MRFMADAIDYNDKVKLRWEKIQFICILGDKVTKLLSVILGKIDADW